MYLFRDVFWGNRVEIYFLPHLGSEDCLCNIWVFEGGLLDYTLEKYHIFQSNEKSGIHDQCHQWSRNIIDKITLFNYENWCYLVTFSYYRWLVWKTSNDVWNEDICCIQQLCERIDENEKWLKIIYYSFKLNMMRISK